MPTSFDGKCFCGAIELKVSGEPAAMGNCHCESCRSGSAGPVNAFSLWPPDSVEISKGEEHLDAYNKTENSRRRWCKICGGHVLTEHPGMGLTDVYASVIPGLPFEPAVHVFYEETVLRIHDGVVKQKDVPAEMGGSGEELSE